MEKTRYYTEFDQHAEQITKRLKHVPDPFMSEMVLCLKYGFWALKHEPDFYSNARLINEHLEYVTNEYGNGRSLDLTRSRQKLDRQIYNTANSLKTLQSKLKIVVKGRDGRPWWLFKNMPNVLEDDKQLMVRQTKSTIGAMRNVFIGYEALLDEAVDKSPFNVSAYFTRPEERKGDAEYYGKLSLNILTFGEDVVRVALALKLPPPAPTLR